MNSFIINLTSIFLKLFSYTVRCKHYHKDFEKIREELGTKNLSIAIWHNDILSSFLAFRKGPFAIMVSQSKDGEIATRIAEKCSNFKFVRGSASRGAKKALLQLIKILSRENRFGVLTVDGPRGPRHIVKPGIIELAKLTNSCIVPLICYPKRNYIFEKSWDKFRVAIPFTTIHIDIGEPILIPDKIDKEDYPMLCEQIKNEMHKAENKIISRIN